MLKGLHLEPPQMTEALSERERFVYDRITAARDFLVSLASESPNEPKIESPLNLLDSAIQKLEPTRVGVLMGKQEQKKTIDYRWDCGCSSWRIGESFYIQKCKDECDFFLILKAVAASCEFYVMYSKSDPKVNASARRT